MTARTRVRHIPDQISKNEVKRFVRDKHTNSQRYPDMLALLLMTLAIGLQVGQFDRSGGKWVREDLDVSARAGDVYRKRIQKGFIPVETH